MNNTRQPYHSPAINQGKNIKVSENQPPNLDTQTVTFSFEYVQKNYCFEKLEKNEKAAVASSIFKRRLMTWRDIRTADRHGLGAEIIKREAIKAAIPTTINFITPDTIFHAMRFMGKKPMVGFRVDRVFHVLWFDRASTLYDHG